MNDWPIRWKIALLTAALVGVITALVGVGVSWHLYREGIEYLDKDLGRVAHGFFNALNERGGQVEWSRPGAVGELLPGANHFFWVEVRDSSNAVLFRSRGLADPQFPLTTGRHAFVTAKVHGELMRIGEFTSHGVVLRIAMGMHAIKEMHDDLRRSYLVAAPLVLLVVGAGGWWIARRALAPVDEITATVERITAQRLNQRLPQSSANDEIGRLTAVLNGMIDRLAASFEQATRFTADASHELKTPLTVIRCELEAALSSGDLAPAQEKLLVDLLDEVSRLSNITESLLLLARADAGRLRLDLQPVAFTTLLCELLEDAEILAAQSKVRIDAELAPVIVRGDSQFLRRLLLNLLDNAIKYNAPDGIVRVRLSVRGGMCIAAVANMGRGIPREEAAHVFDRFYRGDESRSGWNRGCGLGLSICREIARAHGGEIRLDVSQSGWTEFQFILRAEENAARPAMQAVDAPVSTTAGAPAKV